MDDLIMLELLLQDEFVESAPNQLFKSELKQKLVGRSAYKRKKMLYQWLVFALAGVIGGVTFYGVATLIKKNDGKLLCCGGGVISEGSS